MSAFSASHSASGFGAPVSSHEQTSYPPPGYHERKQREEELQQKQKSADRPRPRPHRKTEDGTR